MECGETLIRYEPIVLALRGSDLQTIKARSRQRCRLGPSQGAMEETVCHDDPQYKCSVVACFSSRRRGSRLLKTDPFSTYLVFFTCFMQHCILFDRPEHPTAYHALAPIEFKRKYATVTTVQG